MELSRIPRCSFALTALLAALLLPSMAGAITFGQVDDFQAGTTANWSGAAPANVADVGPNGTGDRALSATAFGGGGSGSKLIIQNSTQWNGDWTAAGVTQIKFDFRNPSVQDLTIRLAISGPNGFGFGGTGDTYSTSGQSVPAGSGWQQLMFDVSPSGWQYVGSFGGSSIDEALANVTQFRLLHNPSPSFIGQDIAATFLVDNITAAAAASPTGDYNGNGIVDAADYVIWRKTLNEPAVPAGSGADGDADGMIDPGDYDFWRARFGNTVPASGAGAVNAAVPEPAASALLLIGLLGWLPLRRRGLRRDSARF